MRTLDVDECAEFLKVDRKTVLRLAGNGTLPGAKIGKAWVFLEDDLVEYLRLEVQKQRRQRQVEAEVQEELDAAIERTPSMVRREPGRRGRVRKARPNLDVLPELTGQPACA